MMRIVFKSIYCIIICKNSFNSKQQYTQEIDIKVKFYTILDDVAKFLYSFVAAVLLINI